MNIHNESSREMKQLLLRLQHLESLSRGNKEAAQASTVLYRITGVFLLLVVIGIAAPYGILNAIGIIDAPAAVALPLFRQQSTTVILAYYSLVWGGILLIPLALLLHVILARPATVSITIATTCGVLAGVMLAFGEIRWPFLLPYLANTYLDPHVSEATRAAITVVYQAVDQYVGIAVGEHLSFLFIGIWSLLLALRLLRSPLFQTWVGWLGILVASSLFISCLEPFDLNVGSVLLISLIVSRIGWALWLIVLAVILLLPRSQVVHEQFPA
jgi:hypothetical protein